MNGKTFVDTNVLVYAHHIRSGAKHDIADALIRNLWESGAGVVSMQVLQEFYVVITRKISQPLAKPSARELVGAYSEWCINTSAADLPAAFRIEDRYRISFWDALIMAAAVKSGASRIVSEDLSANQVIEGITVEDPFTTA